MERSDRTQRNLLQVEGLRRSYGKKLAVADVSFSMHAGEIVGLLGPNGAGKTTVFYIIVGFIRSSAGSIHLDGADITHLPMYRRARLGITYLSQEPSVFRRLTVAQNLDAILETRTDLTTEDRVAERERLLVDFGISEVRAQKADTLSGGERRRTEIARSLAMQPRFLLLDEPFAGIDPIAVTEIKQIVKRLAAQGIGILITDHNVRDTLDITDCSYIINRGEIVASGNRSEILSNELARTIYLGNEFHY